MIKVFFLIFETSLAWERIVLARSGVLGILCLHLLPMVGISCFVEGMGLLHWGRIDSETLLTIQFSRNDVLAYEGMQFGLSLFAVFASARLIKLMAGNFHGRGTFTQAFTVVAYGLSPLFLLRMADALPVEGDLYPWATWIAGILLSIWILYQGVPRLLNPDPTNAFGLYCSIGFNLILVTGLCRGITYFYLLRNIHHLGHHLHRLLPASHL